MSLRIKDGDNEIEILFDYLRDWRNPNFPNTPKGEIATYTTIKFNNKIIVEGYALCSEKDNFCKAIGRKISLTRAIETAKKNGEINKDISKRIWEEYLKCCK